MRLKVLEEFLDSQKVKYTVIPHSAAYTAQEIASVAHIPGKQLAKTVVVWVDEQLAMAVLPASHQVDLHLLKKAARAKTVAIASEGEFKERFPDCELGAMPPFGNLYGLRVFAEETLAQDKEITFNAGAHDELVCLSYEDFERLAMPQVARFSSRRAVLEAEAIENQAKQRLLEKEEQLISAIARLEEEARVSGRPEVGDYSNGATTSEAKSQFFRETTVEWRTLTQVRDALRRIEDGTYGKCMDCGREIEKARLDRLPWAPYCLRDQAKHDKAEVHVGATL